MRYKLYELLVNRHPGICQRYHRLHDNSTGIKKYVSWMYLLWLNLAYLCGARSLGRAADLEIYEEKKLPVSTSESSEAFIDAGELAEKLAKYDVISFDVFDTAVLRPFSRPEDLFYIAGEQLSCMDFKRIRMEAEWDARRKNHEKNGSYEVSLREIWESCQRLTGIPAEKGMEREMAWELKLCRGNDFMKKVYRQLKEAGKEIVFTTDMYLPEDLIRDILIKSGYDGKERIFLSSSLGKSKAAGELYDEVRKTMGEDLSFAHVGDNGASDVKMAERHGFKAFYYPGVNSRSEAYRSFDMSPVTGSAYRGVVNSRIRCGAEKYSMLYEYGYIYGGLFVTGYCHFIHRYCREKGIDRILFLSRDGDILKKVYEFLYPGEETEYVYWSRLAAAKTAAEYMKYDYVRKLIRHKVNRGYTISRVLSEMELEELIPALGGSGLEPLDRLSDKTREGLEDFVNVHWKEILDIYAPQRKAAGQIIGEQLKGSAKAAAVDIGWAGSGAAALALLAEKEWKLPVDITAIVAGTNTALSAEPDMSDPFILSGRLVSYMYSSGENRDLWKKHDPARGYNIFWELLTSSREPSLKGYYPDESTGRGRPVFADPECEPEQIDEIQKGIMDFASDYREAFKEIDYMANISGRDAYAPMLAAASHGERYLKAALSHLNVKEDVGA